MPQFRKKPVVIEAVQFMGGHVSALECAAFVGETANVDLPTGMLSIITLEGQMRVAPFDWVIRGVKGEYYPCKPDIFAATYEVVE